LVTGRFYLVIGGILPVVGDWGGLQKVYKSNYISFLGIIVLINDPKLSKPRRKIFVVKIIPGSMQTGINWLISID
jgi:hypothetical protein